MPYRFKLGEPFGEGFERIAAEQIERALTQLQGGSQQAAAVHETRKCLKRLRALLRLMRPALGDDVFANENARLREIGLGLSGARDRHVLSETVDKLEAAALLNRKGVLQALRRSIAMGNGASEPLTTDQAVSDLCEAKERLAGIKLQGSGFDIVGAGLERSYRRARSALKRAYAKPSDEAFHEWRKGTQQHWRQMTLLARAWPDYLGARAAEARMLSQILGDDHDLAMLVAYVHTPDAALTSEQVSIIEVAARQRQAELRAGARPRGERLFAEGAGRLRRAVQAYWRAAVAIRELEADREAETKPAPIKRKRAPRRRATRGPGG